MNVINIVQGGRVYKYFTSTFTFFKSSCESAKKLVTWIIINLHFASHYDSLVLLHFIYC